MSISTSLQNAFSGLRAASRSVETISNNLANALTEGYARREIELSSLTLDGHGRGVRVAGVERAVDRVATESRRMGGAASGVANLQLNTAERISRAFGDPSEPGSLAQKLTAFETAVVAAANDPASQTSLDLSVLRANQLTADMNTVSASLSEIRQDTEARIASEVDTLNTSLESLHEINIEIRKRVNGGGEINSLIDQRELLIDRVSEIVPVMVVEREYQQVALFTPEGGTLLDGSVAPGKFSFTATPFIDHSMSLGAPLSGLNVNGTQVPIGGGTGLYEGGTLAALFELRDVDVPAYNSKLDGLARDLIERFQDPTVDTTLLVGDPGLFTDAGAVFATANEVGIAGRISVNALADPDQGGASWRMRDGLNSAVPGLTGQNTILRAMEAAMVAQRAPGAGLGLTASMSASGYFGTVTAGVAQNLGTREEVAEFAETRFAVLREAESGRTGIDSDEQLQRLMDVERMYQANARVMQAVDDMLDELMRMGR